MRKPAFAVSATVLLLISTSFSPQKKWINLLDKDLSQWEIYQSYAFPTLQPDDVPKDKNGVAMPPIGLNRNVNNVFSVLEADGELILKISGETYGCVFTRQDFEHYHLKLKVRWGAKKWPPRLDEPMDSGVLYHSVGPPGVDYWRSWMLSQELQIMEGGFGDYWSIANAQIDARAAKPGDATDYRYDPLADVVAFGAGTGKRGFCQKSADYEKPGGQWNIVELICFAGKSLHIVNGHVVLALSGSRYRDGDGSKPLERGRIQLQSEAAEVYYKDIVIKPLVRLPGKYAAYFK